MRRNKSMVNASMFLGLMAALAGPGVLPEPKTPKMKKPKPQYTEEEMAELERLFEDRTSPGRKAYKRYQLQLRMKYAQAGGT